MDALPVRDPEQSRGVNREIQGILERSQILTSATSSSPTGPHLHQLQPDEQHAPAATSEYSSME